MAHLLEVKKLITEFRTDQATVRAVDGVSYHIDEGEIVGLVGESGCGKSAGQLSVLQLITSPPGKIVSGEVIFEGEDILKYKAGSEKMRKIRGGKMGIIFQEPMTSLNPSLTIGTQIMESVMLHLKVGKGAARERALELIRLMGIPDAIQRFYQYPHQFSGGMRQRVMIAIALSCNPRILVADEPTTALDVTIQAQILEILKNMVKGSNTALLVVTHNLGVVARYADRIYVMYAGRVVESGKAKEIFADPRHPYTLGLLKSVPRLDEPKGRKLVPIPGLPPSLSSLPTYCAFYPRCFYRVDACKEKPWPALRDTGSDHYTACALEVGERSSVSVSDRKEYNPRIICDENIVEVKNLKMYFPVTRGLRRKVVAHVRAVDDVSFSIKRGETLGLVGESGCGKSTVARCVLRLYKPTEGQITFQGQGIAGLTKREMRPLRSEMQMIFQDPYSSLDPRQTAGSLVGEPIRVHKSVGTRGEYRQRLAELFRMVGLDPSMEDRVPHEFSGGQRQRLSIARALASEPTFIVCDEPISALDVSIQAQIINLLQELQEKLNLTYLFIAHDLSVVRHISDRVAVMYLGRIVEITHWKALYENPLHPYTKALLSAVPIPDPPVEETRERIILKGDVPSPLNPPPGCSFHPRCRVADHECKETVPQLSSVSEAHWVACQKAIENKVNP